MATNSDSQMIDKVVNREIKFHELDSLVGETKAREIRLKAVEKILKIKMESINSSVLNAEECNPNIENMIGSCQIPLGIAGPVMISGENAKGDFFIPLATTEGALVASVNRGCSVINKSG
jgi:hydroxymethylglutaryl-CoA reductase (NADPH)